MMRDRLLTIALVGVASAVIACGGDPSQGVRSSAPGPSPTAVSSASPSAPPAEVVVTVDADSTMTTPSAATYTAPKGWTVTTRGSVVLLEDSSREVSITIVERKEAEGEAAIAAAWKQVKPEFSRKISLATAPPGRGGWDAAANVDYETTAAERRVVWANARRKGDTWFVMLFDGTDEGWAKRRAGARIVAESFKARGVEEESFAGKTASTLDEKRLRELESFLVEGQQVGKVPGLAVAIVQGGKVVFEKGFGVRELGKKDPVTPNTLFRLGSTTKALTSWMVAALVDEGKFGWDTRATQLLPSFAVGDADLTKRLTMEGLLCACSGIPYDNLGVDFEFKAITPEIALSRLRDRKPITGFRETFQYSNPMIAAAGYIAALTLHPGKTMGPAYYEAMQSKVFGPLGMKSTTFDVKAVQRGDHASPHDRSPTYEMVTTAFPASHWTAPLDPGWGAWSSVRDLSRYLLTELGKGKTPEGKQVVSEANLLKRREPQGRAGDKSSYGLGMSLASYRGVQVVGHPGAVWAYWADLFFLPEHGVGAVVLSNVDTPNPFNLWIFRRKLFELLFDGRDEAREDLSYSARTQEAAFMKEMHKIELEPERAWLDRLAGTYEHPWFGKVTIRVEGNRGVLDVGEWQSSVGRKKEEDGTVKLVTTSAPWIGWPELEPKEADGKTRLVLDDWAGGKAVFEPLKDR